MTYDERRAWSDGLLTAVRHAISDVLIVPAPAVEDQQHCTDLVVLSTRSGRLACRVRHHEYLGVKNYRNEFTIRTHSRFGQTELRKILDGWGDFVFYGFADEAGTGLATYFLGDLDVLRKWRTEMFDQGQPYPWRSENNGGGNTGFNAYTIDDLPPEFVVGRDGVVQ